MDTSKQNENVVEGLHHYHRNEMSTPLTQILCYFTEQVQCVLNYSHLNLDPKVQPGCAGVRTLAERYDRRRVNPLRTKENSCSSFLSFNLREVRRPPEPTRRSPFGEENRKVFTSRQKIFYKRKGEIGLNHVVKGTHLTTSV